MVPNAPPLVDFVTGGEQNANQPTALTPVVSDPAGPRVANHVDHIEWSFDTPTAAHPAGDPSTTDLVCNADGSACHVPGGGVPGPWFNQGNGHQAVVNFFQRALAVHGLPELSTLDLNALPQTGPDGSPLTGGLEAIDGQGRFTVYHDPRVAYLYDNATLLQQTSFALDAGEATGAQLKPGAPSARTSACALESARPDASALQLEGQWVRSPAAPAVSPRWTPTGVATGHADRGRHRRSAHVVDAAGTAAPGGRAGPPGEVRRRERGAGDQGRASQGAPPRPRHPDHHPFDHHQRHPRLRRQRHSGPLRQDRLLHARGRTEGGLPGAEWPPAAAVRRPAGVQLGGSAGRGLPAGRVLQSA